MVPAALLGPELVQAGELGRCRSPRSIIRAQPILRLPLYSAQDAGIGPSYGLAGASRRPAALALARRRGGLGLAGPLGGLLGRLRGPQLGLVLGGPLLGELHLVGGLPLALVRELGLVDLERRPARSGPVAGFLGLRPGRSRRQRPRRAARQQPYGRRTGSTADSRSGPFVGGKDTARARTTGGPSAVPRAPRPGAGRSRRTGPPMLARLGRTITNDSSVRGRSWDTIAHSGADGKPTGSIVICATPRMRTKARHKDPLRAGCPPADP